MMGRALVINMDAIPSYNDQKQPSEVFYEKGVLRNFAKFTGKHLCQSLLFYKVTGEAMDHCF